MATNYSFSQHPECIKNCYQLCIMLDDGCGDMPRVLANMAEDVCRDPFCMDSKMVRTVAMGLNGR